MSNNVTFNFLVKILSVVFIVQEKISNKLLLRFFLKFHLSPSFSYENCSKPP